MEQEPAPSLWTSILETLEQLIVPDWGDAIAFLPLALLGLVALALLWLAFQWRRAGRHNRSRVMPRQGPMTPEGVHLPGPSRWPFLTPIGFGFLLFGLAVPPRDETGAASGFANLPLLGIGLLIMLAGVAGWLWDAMREWRRTEHEAHSSLAHGALVGQGGGPGLAVGGAPVAVLPRAHSEPPPGVHLPGPSPWPFFAPIGLMLAAFGLVFSPALVIGGIVMAILAAAGWYRDAGREYRAVDADRHPEPVSRDPARAFPRRMVGIYAAVAAIALLAILVPSLIALAGGGPGSAPSGPASGDLAGGSAGPGGPSPDLRIAAQEVAFDTAELSAPADTPLKLAFDNREALPHNVAIYTTSALDEELFVGEVFPGPEMRTYEVPPLPAGSFYFLCSVHPTMNGTFLSQ